jgi:cell division protein FtsZ
MAAETKNKLKFQLAEESIGAKIRVIGIGGGGGNALNRMIETGIQGVDFIAVNTDLQALAANRAPVKIQIGNQLTKGLGSGGRPETGKQAAMEDTEKLLEILEGSDMVFLTAGLGGGTGTGATPIVANLASELDILCVAVCTLPFEFEGPVRGKQAADGLCDLRNAVDTVIAIPNDRLLQTVSLDTGLEAALKVADDVLRQAVQGVSDLITKPGLINLDFADIRATMKGMGMAYMGTGIASGENRAAEAANNAISSPLLIDTTIQGAKGILVNVTGGKDLTLHETQKAGQIIRKLAHADANIIFGCVIDPTLRDTVKVTVIATGFDGCSDRVDTSPEDDFPEPAPVRRSTPPPFPVPTHRDTPPFVFDPKGVERPGPSPVMRSAGRSPAWNTSEWEKEYENLDTPAYLRKSHSQMRKNPS